MSEAELIQLNKDKTCTLYTIQFVTEDEDEYMRFFIIDLKTMRCIMKT